MGGGGVRTAWSRAGDRFPGRQRRVRGGAWQEGVGGSGDVAIGLLMRDCIAGRTRVIVHVHVYVHKTTCT